MHDITDTAPLRDKLTGELIGLARATEGNDHMLTPSTAAVTLEGLLATQPGAALSSGELLAVLERVDEEKRKLVPECRNCLAPCGRTDAYDMQRLQATDAQTRSIKEKILSGLRELAARPVAEDVSMLLYRALFAIGMEDWGPEELLPIASEIGAELRKK